MKYQYYDKIPVDFKKDMQGQDVGILVLLAESEKDKIPHWQALARSLKISMAGAVFPMLVVEGKFVSSGMLVIFMENFRYYLKRNISQDTTELKQDAEEVSGAILNLLDDEKSETLFMIFDGMISNIATFLNKLYLKLADRVEYGGVNAGSESFQPMPVLFDTEYCIGNGALFIVLDNPQGSVLEHSYTLPGEIVAATSTEGNKIINIDWMPAFEVYAEKIKLQYGQEITRENFYEHAVHFPLGIIKADDEVLVRIPVALNDDGSIFCVGEIPANSILSLLNAPSLANLQTTEKLSQKITGFGNDLFLLFYCAGRKMHLGEGADVELAELASVIGKSIGALSLGEIGSTFSGGYPSFHNATVVCTGL